MHFQSRNIFFLWLIFTGLLPACTQSTETQEESLAGLPAEFIMFYDQFLSDSAFQIAHISFPLQGLPGPDNIDSNGAFIPWEKASWTIHKPIANSSDYVHTFDFLSDDLIVETIEERDAPIAMQRRYARMADGWHLIYYVDMQPMSKK
jgi:hypothetical protein